MVIEDRCWHCKELLTDDFQMNSAEMMLLRPPMPGDLAICGACGSWLEFDGLLHRVQPSIEKMQAIMNTPQLVDMQARLVKRDGT